MSEHFRDLIQQKRAQLSLVMSALDEFLLVDLRQVGTFTEGEQKICNGMFLAAGVAKQSFRGLLELVAMAWNMAVPAVTEAAPEAASDEDAEAGAESEPSSEATSALQTVDDPLQAIRP